jgi:hypothetical protein
LSGPFLEPADQQHVPIIFEQFFRRDADLREFELAGNRHSALQRPADPPPPAPWSMVKNSRLCNLVTIKALS